MSISFEVQGKIHSIGPTTEYGSNGFTKREFVILLNGEGENAAYPNYIALELIKDKCALMDAYKIGDQIKTQFNLTGRLWSGNGKPEKCFTTLQAWKVDPVKADNETSQETPPPFEYNNFPDDDIPF